MGCAFVLPMKVILEIAYVFFKLGCIAFGGPAAHIAMMEEEIVTKRKWLTRQHFLDLMGATNLIPGPNSTEMTMHCGMVRGGWIGLFVAGICFIFPAALLTGLLGWVYKSYGSLPALAPILSGIKPAVLVIIFKAILKLGNKAIKTWQLFGLGIGVIFAVFLGLNEILVILLAGLIGVIWSQGNIFSAKVSPSFFPIFFLQSSMLATSQISNISIFWQFLKVGATLFGSGYVLVAYLEGLLVEDLGWITQFELIDAIAIGQFTPGPVLTTATFVGYQINGFSGAIMATLGIFLPSFLFVLLINPLVSKLRQSKILSSFLDAVNAASVAVMVAVTIKLGISVLNSWENGLILSLTLGLVLWKPKTNILWIVAGSAALGYLLNLL